MASSVPTHDTGDAGPLPTLDLDALSRVVAKLNASSNVLSSVVSEIEVRLKSWNIGLRVRCKFTSGVVIQEGATSHELGYDKINGKWGICIAEVGPVGSGVRYEWRFCDAPRALRIDAVLALPELIHALVIEAAHCADDIERATCYARELLNEGEE